MDRPSENPYRMRERWLDQTEDKSRNRSEKC